MVSMKICRICYRELSVSCFPLLRDKRKNKPYYFYACFECKNKANLAYYHRTKPPLRVYDDAYREKRKKEIRHYIRLYMRKYRKISKSAPYNPSYLQPLIQSGMQSASKERGYAEKLRNGMAISPSPEWTENWAKKTRDNNNRIINKYSSSPSPEAQEEPPNRLVIQLEIEL